MEIFRAGTEENPGRYYFVNSRKLVPKQTLKDGSDNPEFTTDKYKIVPKPDRRSKRDTTDYSVIRSSEPTVTKNLSISGLVSLAHNYGWKLSTKCARAISSWGKSSQELEEFFAKHRELFPKENYLDYSADKNSFLCKYRNDKQQ